MNDLVEIAARIDLRWVLAALLLALDVWAIGLVLLSVAARREKVLWSSVIVLCPIVGCLFWFVLGPKPTRSTQR
jgi:hypothetical protein